MVERRAECERLGEGRYRITGWLVRETVPAVMATLERESGGLGLDLGGVEGIDTAGVAMLAVLRDRAARRGAAFRLEAASTSVEALMAVLPDVPPQEEASGEGEGFVVGLGGAVWRLKEGAKAGLALAWATCAVVLLGPWRGRGLPSGSVAMQAVRIGVDALPIVSVISFLVGLIVAFQAAYQLERFGASILVANLVGLSMVRELGPLMTAIILAGRSGSAIAAELGTMVVQEEVAAMRTMGLDPVRHLVAPRMVAIAWTGPLLALMSMAVGIFGGMLIAWFYLQIGPDQYLDQTFRIVRLPSLANGAVKSLIFSLLVGFIGSYTGLRITGGATAVGEATTRSVVTSIFAIVVADSLVTTLTVRVL